MAQIAIQGHPTRGKEVIQLLEMFGGKNIHRLDAIRDCYVYFVMCDKNKTISSLKLSQVRPEQFIIYSLEEFFEKFPYKVGDKVITKDKFIGTITDIRWQGDSFFVGKEEGDIVYTVQVSTTGQITYPKENLQPYKEETMNTNNLCTRCVYAVDNHCGLRGFTNDFNRLYCSAQNADKLPNGFELQPDGYFSWVDSKPQYPKDYEECCKLLMGKTNFSDFSLVLTKFSTNINEENSISPEPPYISLINKFYKLLICLNAYWKLAGEEMGLDKPWKQDYDDRCFIIANNNGNIHTYEYHGTNNIILAFPTTEMRDAFYKNFKELIEQCKELL